MLELAEVRGNERDKSLGKIHHVCFRSSSRSFKGIFFGTINGDGGTSNSPEHARFSPCSETLVLREHGDNKTAGIALSKPCSSSSLSSAEKLVFGEKSVCVPSLGTSSRISFSGKSSSTFLFMMEYFQAPAKGQRQCGGILECQQN